MGTWTLWIAFNVTVGTLLVADLALFHRHLRGISLAKAALETAGWVALSLAFGSWIYFSHGRAAGLEFFTGYVIEESLSMDNVFVFLLIFKYFRVDPRYQHRLLFWGVLGALVMRGVLIGAGIVLIQRFEWILYLFGAFLVFAGFRLISAEHTVEPEKNPVVNWTRKLIPMTPSADGPQLFVREGGKWLATPLFLVILVIETTDLLFALDSIPAVFGITRDPFLIYSSNVCAILGLRSFYFLLAGVLPYFRYLTHGLSVVLIFIGAKMLVEPWVHIPVGIALGVVAGAIAVSIVASVIATVARRRRLQRGLTGVPGDVSVVAEIHRLAEADANTRSAAAAGLFAMGARSVAPVLQKVQSDPDWALLLPVPDPAAPASPPGRARLTVGLAVHPDTFERIRAANGSPALAAAPADQDVKEFELHFPGSVALDVLTPQTSNGDGEIARFLARFGEGIQQVEVDVADVDRATELFRARFAAEPVYPAARPGADRTRVNFFLLPVKDGGKTLIELVEAPQTETRTEN